MRQATAALALLAMLALVTSTAPASEWVPVSSSQISEAGIEVLESSDTRTVIEYEIGGFLTQPVEIEGASHIAVAIPGAGPRLERGLPDLPAIRRSIVIPDDGVMGVRILEADYAVESTVPVAPSKGPITRNIDPATVPYAFDAAYRNDAEYPPRNVVLHEPYIMRDLRGLVVELNPIQYNPARGTLKIARRIVVEIYRAGPGGANVKERSTGFNTVAAPFEQIYRDHFLNYGMGLRYDPIPEPGRLVMITYDAFRTDVDPLYNWKVQEGVPTEIYNLSSVGGTASQIKSFIDGLYAAPEGLTYVILVGDKQQVPTMSGTNEGADSDPCYAKCEGNDNYPDLFISRISAQNAAEVQTQVAKVLNYEKLPDTGGAAAWYAKAMGIASNEGSPPDWQRCDWLRDMLLGYTFTEVDQIYDPGASASQVTAALNQGRSVLNYIGHGSGTSWGTTGFNNTAVHALSNVGMLPWIIDVSCDNGAFGMSECFAEAWLRAGSAAAPTGAIGDYASSTLASWVPPCTMQNHAIELLTTGQRNTIGGMFFNGVMHAMDVHTGSEGVKLMEQYNIFGDCSMMVRTAVPEELAMQHLGVLLIGLTSYDVTVTKGGSPIAGALVCGRTDNADHLYAYGYTDAGGQVTLDLGGGATTVGTLELTATAYNGVPAFDSATVVPPSGAYCVYDSHVVDDDQNGSSSGNGDGLAGAGEQLELLVSLRNVGNDTAIGVSATLSESSPYVTVTDDYEEFGDIPAGGTAPCLDDFDVAISGSCPDGETVQFDLETTDGVDTWPSTFSLTVGAPALTLADLVVDDPPPGGNGNGCAEAGETLTLTVTMANSGTIPAANLQASINTFDTYVTIVQGEATAALVPPLGGTATLAPAFEIALAPDTPPYYEPALNLLCRADGGYRGSESFSVLVGSATLDDQFENGEGAWTHASVTGGADQWHLETYRSSSPTHSWKFGGAGAGTYLSDADGALESPPVCLGSGGQLDFSDWLDAEQYTSTLAWDCAVVEISTDLGESWGLIVPIGGYSHTVYSSSTVPLPAGTPCWSGNHGWRAETFDLAAYEGSQVMFRFRFLSDSSVTREGWYVDDVAVSSTTTGIEPLALGPRAARFALAQNVPNPFNPTTTIGYTLPEGARATLRVYDVGGRRVRTLVDAVQEAGSHQVVWDGTGDGGRQLASGIYYCHLEAGRFSQRRTMVLLK